MRSKKSRLQPFPEQGETSDRATTRAPLRECGNEVGGGIDVVLVLGLDLHLQTTLVEPHLGFSEHEKVDFKRIIEKIDQIDFIS